MTSSEYSKLWRLRNKERAKAYDDARKEKSLARVNAWKKANPEFKLRENHRRRARKRGELSVGIRDKLIALQKGKCAVCRGVPKIWHLDHIVPLAAGGSNTDDNAQMLCGPCNWKRAQKTQSSLCSRLGCFFSDLTHGDWYPRH